MRDGRAAPIERVIFPPLRRFTVEDDDVNAALRQREPKTEPDHATADDQCLCADLLRHRISILAGSAAVQTRAVEQ
jgi:hypothetical protein